MLMNEWMNQRTNERTNEPTNQPTNQSIYEWINEWINEWMNEWMKQSMNCLFVCLGFNGTFSTNRLYCAITVGLETKASSPAGQCILAGCSVTLPRRVLITMSIITMRSRLFPANSASVCLRFAKSRPQFCEYCGATYKWICEMFSALQSTSGPVTDVVDSVQIAA